MSDSFKVRYKKVKTLLYLFVTHLIAISGQLIINLRAANNLFKNTAVLELHITTTNFLILTFNLHMPILFWPVRYVLFLCVTGRLIHCSINAIKFILLKFANYRETWCIHLSNEKAFSLCRSYWVKQSEVVFY